MWARTYTHTRSAHHAHTGHANSPVVSTCWGTCGDLTAYELVHGDAQWECNGEDFVFVFAAVWLGTSLALCVRDAGCRAVAEWRGGAVASRISRFATCISHRASRIAHRTSRVVHRASYCASRKSHFALAARIH